MLCGLNSLVTKPKSSPTTSSISVTRLRCTFGSVVVTNIIRPFLSHCGTWHTTRSSCQP